MVQINEVNNSLTAKMVTCMLCDNKMKGRVVSIATDSAIKDFYKMLSLKHSTVSKDYTLLAFIKLIKSFKAYIELNPSKSLAIQKELLDHNVSLINYSKEVRECHAKINTIAKWLEIKDVTARVRNCRAEIGVIAASLLGHSTENIELVATGNTIHLLNCHNVGLRLTNDICTSLDRLNSVHSVAILHIEGHHSHLLRRCGYAHNATSQNN